MTEDGEQAVTYGLLSLASVRRGRVDRRVFESGWSSGPRVRLEICLRTVRLVYPQNRINLLTNHHLFCLYFEQPFSELWQHFTSYLWIVHLEKR